MKSLERFMKKNCKEISQTEIKVKNLIKRKDIKVKNLIKRKDMSNLLKNEL